MTVDEALTWARATDNERWQLLTETRDKDLDRGADYVLRRAACIETLAQEVKRLRSEMLDASAVCACGHPDADHENRGSDGLTHDCEYDCVRTSASVCAMLEMLRADLARVTNERDALAKRVMDYDTLLTAEMPLDFKDWHQNSKSEWPEVAAWCLRHRQEQLQHVTDERDALHEAAHKHHADMDVVIAERDALVKRWEAIQSHVVGVDDDACGPAVDEWDAGWSEAFSDVREKMRELEAGE